MNSLVACRNCTGLGWPMFVCTAMIRAEMVTAADTIDDITNSSISELPIPKSMNSQRGGLST